jgi:hypothetical protein
LSRNSAAAAIGPKAEASDGATRDLLALPLPRSPARHSGYDPPMAELDITSSVANYREAARHLWNCHYRPTLAGQDPWDVRERFDRVSAELFKSLVSDTLGIDCGLTPDRVEPRPVDGIRVRPFPESGVPIMINRDRPRSGYWDHPKSRVVAGEAELLLGGFFDFDMFGPLDFRYLEVLIASPVSDPDLAGRWALLEFECARVIYCGG